MLQKQEGERHVQRIVENVNSITSLPKSLWNVDTCGTYSHGGKMDYPRISIMEWNIGKFPDSVEFQR